MLDKQLLLQHPDIVRESILKRGCDPDIVDTALKVHKLWKDAQQQLEEGYTQLRILSKQVRDLKRSGDRDAAQATITEIKSIQDTVATHKNTAQEHWQSFQELISKCGNIVHDTVPVSMDEKDNVVITTFNTPTVHNTTRSHHHLLRMIGGYAAEEGSAVSGHRGYYLTGPGMLLNMALANYGVHFLTKRGYLPIQPPYFMNPESMHRVAQLSQYDEELYHVSGGDREYYLIATSEQPIAAYNMNKTLRSKEMPIRYAGYSSCFRKEAGAYGKDCWGIFRVHQFDKVEQFVVTTADQSWAEQERMLKISEEFLQSLGLGYRVVNIVSGELNNAAAKKYDIEGWFPAQNGYRELVSCTNCTDYQARSVGMKLDNGEIPHTLNSTLCATTRVICAILENYQTDTGVKVPTVLQPYVGGATKFPFIKKLS